MRNARPSGSFDRTRRQAAAASLRGGPRGLKPAAVSAWLGAIGLALVSLPAAPLAAQEQENGWPADVRRAVRDGMAETLEARFRRSRKPDEIHLIAQAYANQARRARKAADRARAVKRADERYRQWIESLEEARRRAPGAKADVALAGARVEHAGMLMGLRAAEELDQFEITAGQQGDRDQLQEIFGAAREQYRQADRVIRELHEELDQREDEFLAAGIYETVIQLRLDIAFNEAWANYYLGVIEESDEQKRGAALRVAERKFQDLLESGQGGQMLFQCHLGAAVAQRELKRYDVAERNFAQALQDGVDPVVEAQARYELARCHVANEKFAEARTVLQPLLEKDAENLPPEQRAARFYINLARLWHANSYLAEAKAIQAEAVHSTAKTAIRRQARRAREKGLAKLNRLAGKGGPWPAIVQLYIAAGVNLRADPAQLSPTELLYSARMLADARRHKEALRRLEEAVSRPQFQQDPQQRSPEESEIGGQLLMELGKCYYRLGQPGRAAETFAKLAGEYRSHELARQGATFAYQLWAEIARKSKKREDYARLADTLLNLIQSFPDHPEREEAAWLLPVALQAAGRYAAAADEFAKVGESCKHRDEAQFRRVLCQRLALEAERGGRSADEYVAQARQVATALTDYADETSRRAAELTPTEAKALIDWSAAARVSAAELLAGQGARQYEPALAAVAGFESRYPGSDLVGRVLAVRIRAHRGLRQFGKATQILEKYLQTVPAERTGAVLSSLARGMQEEVERLQQDGRCEAARQLAAESVETFAQLEKWLRQDEQRARNVAVVTFGRAQMLYIARQLEQAEKIVAGLLRESPQNGNYQRLLAQILSAQLTDASTPAQLKAAQEAWAELLKDPTIRKRVPQRFWEARYNWLSLLLRAGAAADVERAIKQELIWYPDLGGPPWKDRLLALRQQARARLGLPEEDEPAGQSDERPATNPP